MKRMDMDYARPNVAALADRWWALVVRGIAAIALGVLVLVAPATLLILVMLWGAYALVDGVFSLVEALHKGQSGRRWGWLVFEGVVGIAVGAFTLTRPGITTFVLLFVIAVWAVLTGIAEIATAVRLRRQLPREWMLIANGVLSIAFGALLLISPRAGAITLAWMIAVYAILSGALLTGLGFRLKHWDQSTGARPLPTGGRTITG